MFYGRAPDAAGHTGILTMDEARHMALDFAKLNRTVQWPRDGVTACRPPDRKCRRQIRDVPFFWLNYCHPNGCFAGSAVIEASALISARMMAAVYGLNDRLKFASGHEFDDASAYEIPENMIGRLLDDRDLRRLQQALMPKKPLAPSVRRRTAARKVGKR